MKHKKLTVCILFAFIALSLFVAVACNDESTPVTPDDSQSHSHTFSTQWTNNEIYHWHAATCGHAQEVDNIATHSFQDGTCIVCSYKLPHNHTFSTQWTFDDTYHWHAATCEHTEELSDVSAHNLEDNVCSICGYQHIPSTLSLSDASKWGPAVAFDEDDVYVASNDSDGNLVFNFAKNDTYNATRIMFSEFDIADLQKVKTLVVTAKMTTEAPSPALLFKVEGTDDNFDGGIVEVKVKATEYYVTYEWDFGGYDLTKVIRFLIFADPGVAGSFGTITISDIYLTESEVNPDNDATKMSPDGGITPNSIWNEVTAENTSIGCWFDGTPNNVYIVTKNADGTYTIDVHKNTDAGEWDALFAYVYGDALTTMKSFKLVVRGTAGKQIIVKPFDNFEQRITLTGEEQEITIDVSSFTADTTKDFSKKDAPSAENKIVVIGEPGTNFGNDTFTIISAEFII